MDLLDSSMELLGTAAERTDRHSLGGIVKINGAPARKFISVFDRRYQSWVATRQSKLDGTWQIYGLPEYPERSLYVVAFDHTGEFNAEVFDYVSQVAPTP